LIAVFSKFEGITFTRRMVMLTKRSISREQEEVSNSFCYTPEEFKRKKDLETASSLFQRR